MVGKAVDYVRQLTGNGFYSPAAEAVAAAKQQKGRVEDFVNAIRGRPGVTKEELEGVSSAFAPGQSVTRDEMANHFHGSIPNIQESVYQNAPIAHRPNDISDELRETGDQPTWSRWQATHEIGPRGNYYYIDEANNGEHILRHRYGHSLGEFTSLDQAVQEANNRIAGINNPPKFFDYSLPGGTNYREVVMHAPPAGGVQPDSSVFRSSHWTEPNVVAHLRMSERPGNALHIDEIQSDWGQGARDHGFIGDPDDNAFAMRQRVQDLRQKMAALNEELANSRNLPAGANLDDHRANVVRINAERNRVGEELAAIPREFKEPSNAVPRGPYVNSTEGWTDLALKRALRAAAEGGHDKLVWTPGAEQAARYNLARHVREIAYNPERERLYATSHTGEPVGPNHRVSQNELAGHVGKDVAKALLAREPNNIGMHTLRGDDLSIGGQGMLEYYDRIVPSRLQKILKKVGHNAQIDMHSHELPQGAGDGPVMGHALHITPELRELIMKGLPAYKSGGSVDSVLDMLRARHHHDAGGSEPGSNASRFVNERLFGDDIREITRPSPMLDQYSDRTADAVSRANAERPYADASDFVRHQLNREVPQLPQRDREAEARMRDYGKEAIHLGAYATPLAPAVAAYDAYEGLRSGGPLTMAMSAAGAPGRATKAGLLAASILSPTEAHAGSVPTKYVRELIQRANHGLQSGLSHIDEIDSRIPTGVRRIEMDEHGAPRIADVMSMRQTPDLFDTNVGVVRDYPHAGASMRRGSSNAAAERFVDHVTDNLLYLHDLVPEDIRARSAKWYEGGNALVKQWANKYGIPESSAAGAIAALSPQKDWFQNVSLAERVLDSVRGRGENFYRGYAFTPQMEREFLSREKLNTDKMQPLLEAIRGKSLGDIDRMGIPPEQSAQLKALWVRLHDHAERSPSYRLVTPEGGFGDYATNMDESQSRAGWGSLTEIGKAIRAIESGGGAEALSDLMGKKHKVRSFYNNLLAPFSTRGDVTADTHAVAAGLLRPLSGNDLEVAHNFANYAGKGMPGVSGSSASGIQGTYPLYADAYRRAANERRISPREMQSITWEAVRGLFPDTFKTPENNAVINKIWNDYAKRRITLDQARENILDFAGGIDAPAWHR